MPIFEYTCSDCRERFELLILSSRAGAAQCPDCGSGRVKKLFSAFAVTGRASGGRAGGSGCAGCTSTRGWSSCSSGGGRG